MALRFVRLTRPNIRQLKHGEKLTVGRGIRLVLGAPIWSPRDGAKETRGPARRVYVVQRRL